MGDDMPVGLEDKPRIVVHIYPARAAEPAHCVDLGTAERHVKELAPICVRDPIGRYNLDGFLTWVETDTGIPLGYVQLFRAGMIEAVDNILLSEARTLPIVTYERYTRDAVKRYLSVYRSLRIEPPVFIILGLLGVQGYALDYLTRDNDTLAELARYERHPLDRDVVLLPEVAVTDYETETATVLRPAFDALWQGFGLPQSLNYDAQGNYRLM